MALLFSPKVAPILLLVLSNVFMTFAWYGHLKFKTAPLYVAVIGSWMIAFFEYWLAVPANRIGHQVYSAAELKTMQEVITLNHLLGFALIAGGAALIFRG
ncbi:MAG TPA: DMT family protein [Mesorhizobium sp.]|nr:DMT family protein [Mesorhizobium sp.]